MSSLKDFKNPLSQKYEGDCTEELESKLNMFLPGCDRYSSDNFPDGVFLPTSNGKDKIFAVTVQPKEIKSQLVIINSHGNAESASDCFNFFKSVVEILGCKIVVYDYKGYGCSTGEKSMMGLSDDLFTVVKYVVSQGVTDVILLGRSIGSIPSVSVYERFTQLHYLKIKAQNENNLKLKEEVEKELEYFPKGLGLIIDSGLSHYSHFFNNWKVVEDLSDYTKKFTSQLQNCSTLNEKEFDLIKDYFSNTYGEQTDDWTSNGKKFMRISMYLKELSQSYDEKENPAKSILFFHTLHDSVVTYKNLMENYINLTSSYNGNLVMFPQSYWRGDHSTMHFFNPQLFEIIQHYMDLFFSN